ncbi:MAG TPA: DUF2726 domain-containing protein [Sphingobium sp.]|nr:DUF2726 domain-containing protein [Sphingobium sp.]
MRTLVEVFFVPPEIVALIDKPWLLFLVMFAGAVLGMTVERVLERANRAKRRAYWERRNARNGDRLGWNKGKFGKEITPSNSVSLITSAPDAADQLRIVMEADFQARSLLNKPERRLFVHLARALAEEAPGWRAMGQVALGEILSSPSKDAYFAINSKRVDLLIVDEYFRPLHAIEFQGAGHHQGTAAARDAVKKEALRRAGIGYVEIVSGDTPADVRAAVRKLTNQAGAGS